MKYYDAIKKNTDFKKLYKAKKPVVSESVVIYARRGRSKNRLGITASKKLGSAVLRNFAKRRLRAIFTEYLIENKSDIYCDFIIVARHKVLTKDYQSLKNEVFLSLKTATGNVYLKK